MSAGFLVPRSVCCPRSRIECTIALASLVPRCPSNVHLPVSPPVDVSGVLEHRPHSPIPIALPALRYVLQPAACPPRVFSMPCSVAHAHMSPLCSFPRPTHVFLIASSSSFFGPRTIEQFWTAVAVWIIGLFLGGRTDGRTDRQTDRRTYVRTHPASRIRAYIKPRGFFFGFFELNRLDALPCRDRLSFDFDREIDR
jgi:hypothetical protein